MDDDFFFFGQADASGINENNIWRNKARLESGADIVLKCESASCLIDLMLI